MKNTVKKLISLRFDRYQETESKLEKLAANGLLLVECGTFLWTFQRCQPQNLKYTVTFFSEGSIFNPDVTENQQTYFEYAKAAGWNFVTQMNQMQIFSSDAENPVPFETDEKEKFYNIKKCMNKSFLPSAILLLLVFALNLVVLFQGFLGNPIDFLSDSSRLLSASMILAVVLYQAYSLLGYLAWCRRSQRSIEAGGGCAGTGFVNKIVEIAFLCLVCGLLACLFLQLAFEISWWGILLSLVQVPILMLLFRWSIRYFKKRKTSATINKTISVAVLMLANFAYLTFILLLLINYGLGAGNDSDYRTVNWQLSDTESHQYRLYDEKIPLTCQDLYGPIDYDYYSYEKEIDSTIFLTKSNCRQNSLPAKDAPPRIEYEILEPRFDFVYQLAKNQLLELPTWKNMSYQAIDPQIFKTVEAYQAHYDAAPTGEYLLFYEDKIMVLQMEEALTTEQILVVREKLHL